MKKQLTVIRLSSLFVVLFLFLLDFSSGLNPSINLFILSAVCTFLFYFQFYIRNIVVECQLLFSKHSFSFLSLDCWNSLYACFVFVNAITSTFLKLRQLVCLDLESLWYRTVSFSSFCCWVRKNDWSFIHFIHWPYSVVWNDLTVSLIFENSFFQTNLSYFQNSFILTGNVDGFWLVLILPRCSLSPLALSRNVFSCEHIQFTGLHCCCRPRQLFS